MTTGHDVAKLDPVPERLLRLPDVLARIPVSKSTWWAGVKTGRYPAAVKLGPNMTAWRSSEIDRLVVQQ